MKACLRPDLAEELAPTRVTSNAMQHRSVNSRRVRVTEDRETFEKDRLQKRTGGFYQYVDSAEIFRPDPVSTHFIHETDRF
jgi:hypothetical protein